MVNKNRVLYMKMVTDTDKSKNNIIVTYRKPLHPRLLVRKHDGRLDVQLPVWHNLRQH